MQQINTFPHNGVTYEFKPPINVPDGAHIENLGQLAGFAVSAASPDLYPTVAEKLQASVATFVNAELGRKPEHTFLTIQAALRGKHSVSIS